MEKKVNHTCSICGKKYYFCRDCGDVKSFTPWRTIVDKIDHYKIFLIIQDYVNKCIQKSEAKAQLEKIDLSEKDTFIHEIKLKIDEIMADDIVTNKKSKRKNMDSEVIKSNNDDV